MPIAALAKPNDVSSGLVRVVLREVERAERCAALALLAL